jgi:SAM-dependent methyltransferase
VIRGNIDGGRAFDWGRASADYSKYRDIYPESFYGRIAAAGLCVKGQNVLDLGTGTGVLPRGLYRYGASFTGADISEGQIAEARRLTAESGMDIEYVAAPAEKLKLPDASFDVITACMCYIYFDEAAALPNIIRMLKPGGLFCVLSMIWLPRESEIAAKSERLVLKQNPGWTGAGFTRQPPRPTDAASTLFTTERAEAFDLSLSFTRESWHGRMKACRGMGASSLPAEKLAAFEREHGEYLSGLPESFTIPHYATMLVLKPR